MSFVIVLLYIHNQALSFQTMILLLSPPSTPDHQNNFGQPLQRPTNPGYKTAETISLICYLIEFFVILCPIGFVIGKSMLINVRNGMSSVVRGVASRLGRGGKKTKARKRGYTKRKRKSVKKTKRRKRKV
jgi:hypothetical protein